MNSLNLVVLSGRLGSDPEVSYFDNNKVKASFSLAVENRQDKENPNWTPIETWGQPATFVANDVRQGDEIAIEGSITRSSWVDRNTGEKKSRLYVNAYRVHAIKLKKYSEPMAAQQYQQPQAQSQQYQQQQQPSQYTQPVAPTYTVPAGDTGDIPF